MEPGIVLGKVKREKLELDEKIKRLIFLLSKPNYIDSCELQLMHIQVHIMVSYSEVLHQRLKLMGDPDHASTSNNQRR